MSTEENKINAQEGAEGTTGDEGGAVYEMPRPEEKTATAKPGGVYVHTFSEPFEYGKKKYQTLNFYFNRLKGRDMIAVENEMMALNEVSLAPEISTSYQSKLAARAAGVGSPMIEDLPLEDFKTITDKTRDFLLSMGLTGTPANGGANNPTA